MQKTNAKKPKATLVSRQVALMVLQKILEKHTPLQEALEVREFQSLSADNRAFVRMLLTTTLRYYGALKAILAAHLAKPLPKKTEVAEYILLLGIAEGLFLKTPDYAVVSNTVDLLRHKRFAGLGGLGNAVMRKILPAAETLQTTYCTPQYLLPSWFKTRLETAFGITTTQEIVAAHQNIPPLDITCFKEQADWARRLGGTLLHDKTIRIEHAEKIDVLPGFTEGAWQVQDLAAALPATLFGNKLDGKTIIDVCAAPGGKSIQLAKAGAAVIALDSSKPRALRLMENARRMAVFSQIQVRHVDALEWKPPQLVDGVLLDAPCSATGTLRRHPDVAWHKRESDLAPLQFLQKSLLAHTAQWLKSGGILVYATCSLLPEEGEDVIAHFLDMNPDFSRVALDATKDNIPAEMLNSLGDLRVLPCYFAASGGVDGFYAAKLLKQ